jgi:hypothetical protein
VEVGGEELDASGKSLAVWALAAADRQARSAAMIKGLLIIEADTAWEFLL